MTAPRILVGIAALGLALASGTVPSGATEMLAAASPSPDASGSPSPTPAPAEKPAFLRGLLGSRTRPAPRPKPSPSASASPSPSPTPAPAGPATATPRATPRATPAIPKRSATSKPTSTSRPTATARPTAIPRPTSVPRPASLPRSIPTPRLTATPHPAPTPLVTPSAAPVPAIATARPLGALQPTIPQTLADPRIKAVIARPIPELSQFAWLSGTWRARNSVELPNGKRRDLGENIYVFAATMKGRWIFGADGKAADEFYITFDPFAHHFVLARIEGDPSYGIWESTQGWRDGDITFMSSLAYANGRPYRRRITFEHHSARTFEIYDEEQLADGSWIADDAVELTKEQ